ncbi:MAG TPA: Pycsar system effector family protein [Aldersonia sp.]
MAARKDEPVKPAHSESPRSADPNPEHAWKLLSVVNEWIRHADAKATVALAFTGAMGTLLFNMVKDLPQTGIWTKFFTVCACALLVTTGVFCGLTLTPRTRNVDKYTPNEINRLFYGHISEHFRGQRIKYRDVLHTLTIDPQLLTQELADQICANSQIAAVKSLHVQRAIRAMLAAGVMLSIVSVLIAR